MRPDDDRVSDSEQRAREQLLRVLLDQTPDLVYLKDVESRFLLANQATAHALGVESPFQVVGKTDFDFFPEERAREFHADERKVLEEGTPLIAKTERFERPGQDARWVQSTKIPIRDRSGRITGLVGINRDVTAQALATKEMQESEERFRTLFESADVGIALVDEAGGFLRANRAFQKMLGYTEDELRSMVFADYTHPDDLEMNRRQFQGLVSGRRRSYRGEKRYIDKAGHIVWGRRQVSAVRDDQGNLRYVVGVVEDITEQKRVEEALRASEERFRMLFEAAPIGLMIADADGRYLRTNSAFQEMLGYTDGELRSMSSADVTYPDDLDEAARLREDILRGRRRYSQREKRYVRKDGRVLWARTTGFVARDVDGDIQYVLGMVEDLTEGRAAAEAIQALRLDLDYPDTEAFGRQGMGVPEKAAGVVARQADEDATERARAPREYPCGTIVGVSEAMERVYTLMEAAGRSDVPVLLSGETGTGKDLIAQAIHYESSRRDKPFHALDCAALPDSLVESELFGHERGAFTGAETAQGGKLELAHGGTLFLNEVAELPTSVQGKLLQVLDRGHFMRVGGRTLVQVDARVIAAVNCDVEEAVREGKLRRDLYHRLSVLSMALPPLRDRREDIPLLVEHYLARFAAGEKVLAPGVMQFLAGLPWEGNVRELRNAVERAVLLSGGREIRRDDFHLAGESATAPSTPLPFGEWVRALTQESDADHGGDLLEQAKDALIRAALAEAGGNYSAAARLLGVERRKIGRHLGRRMDSAAPQHGSE